MTSPDLNNSFSKYNYYIEALQVNIQFRETLKTNNILQCYQEDVLIIFTAAGLNFN